jgi:hypothetical protein
VTPKNSSSFSSESCSKPTVPSGNEAAIASKAAVMTMRSLAALLRPPLSNCKAPTNATHAVSQTFVAR